MPWLCTSPSASTVSFYKREDNGLNEYFGCTGLDFVCLINTLQLLSFTATKILFKKKYSKVNIFGTGHTDRQ